MEIDRVIDYFVDHYDQKLILVLLKTLSFKEQGGLGYSLKLFNPVVDMDGWEVNHTTRTIYLDRTGLISNYEVKDIAESLKLALETEILKIRASLLSQYGWGTGKVLLGVVEVGVGLVGIVVPEPGTTVAGVIVFSLGTNSIADGFTQLAGTNKGHGYNILSESSGFIGAGLADLADRDKEIGRSIGKGVFFVSSLAFGAYGNIKVLRVPKQTMFRFGVGGQPGGMQVGRLDLLYGSHKAKDGLTVLSINNNANKSILRFVTHDGRLLVNGRIFGVSKVLRHEGSAKEVMKGLLKLLKHGVKH